MGGPRITATQGLEASRWTFWRAAKRGEVPHTLTPGGHVRIDPAWVASTFPVLAARVRTAA